MRELELQLRAYGAVLDRSDTTVTDVVDALPRLMRRSYIVAIAAAIVVALVASAIVVGATRSSSGRPPRILTPSPTTVAKVVPPSRVLMIGDSVMEGAKGALESAIPGAVVDAVVSRQFSHGEQVIKEYTDLAALPDTLVIALGTNGTVTAGALDAIMRAAGPQRQVYFVEVRVPRTWESEVNAALDATPSRWPNAHVIGWHDYANVHDEWFVLDGFHLTTAGQHAYALLIRESIGRTPPPTTTTTVPTTSALDVVNVIDEPTLPPAPLAVAGGKVWIGTRSRTGTPSVHLEGRDPATTKVVDTIDVPQEAVFSIAGDGDSLWVAGGGDGGVPQTTVSKVDVRTGTVVFTKTLTGTPCSCPIVAGTAGVWLVGNGSTDALHLSAVDGHVISRVHFSNAGATAAMEVRARLVVGLADGSIAIVDPSGGRIERMIPPPTIGDPPVEQVSAMSAVDIPAIGTDSAIDGIVMRRGGSESLFFAPGQVDDFLSTGFVPATVTSVRPFVWVFGGDRLQVNSSHAVVSNEFAYDAARHRFDRVPTSPESHQFGFRDAIATDSTVWVVYDAADGTGPASIVVINAAPDAVPLR
jgi:hypothetical protein